MWTDGRSAKILNPLFGKYDDNVLFEAPGEVAGVTSITDTRRTGSEVIILFGLLYTE